MFKVVGVNKVKRMVQVLDTDDGVKEWHDLKEVKALVNGGIFIEGFYVDGNMIDVQVCKQ